MTTTEALFWSERIAAIGLALTNAELLTTRRAFTDGGILSLSTLRLRDEFMTSGSARLARIAMRYRFVVGLIAIRLVGAIAILVLPGGQPIAVVAEGLIVTVNVLFAWVRLPGGDGSDQMLSVVSAAIFLARAIGDDHFTARCLWFLCAQACLAYASAGVAKLISRAWRDGTALQGVMRTASYGSRSLHGFLSRRYALCVALSWGVMLFEAAFPLVVVLPRPVVYAFLVGGMFLHQSIAVAMRLNVFVWAFLAPYPAILFCTQWHS
ncbi:MAG TPA: hypothetical protein VGL81_23580 [Polyangiaceae bacterium]